MDERATDRAQSDQTAVAAPAVDDPVGAEDPTPPGWYLDPTVPVRLRWHDGERWTDQACESLPTRLARDDLPLAMDDLADEAAELRRSVLHAGWLLVGSMVLLVLLPFAWLPVLAAISLVQARRARSAWRDGSWSTARRRHRAARRWRLVAYASIPAFLAFAVLLAVLALGQLAGL